MHTSVEHETVHANLLVARNAHALYKLLLVTYRGEGRHEPAVAVIALPYIVCGRAFYEELWVIEDVLMRYLVSSAPDEEGVIAPLPS